MRLRIFAADVVDVVGSYQGNARLAVQSFDIGQDFQLFFQPLVLHLEEKMILAENLPQGQRFFFRRFVIVIKQKALHPARKASGQGDDAPAVLPQHVVVDARLVVKPADKAFRYDFHQVFIAVLVFCQKHQMASGLIELRRLILHAPGRRIDLASQDGLDALLLGFFIKVDDAKHNAVVGNGAGIHAQLLYRCNQLADSGGAIQQAVFCMYMQMGKCHS